MDKITKLSQAIRYGCTFIKDYRISWTSYDNNCGCAIGTAYLAVINREGRPGERNIVEEVANRFGVPFAIIQQVSCKHYNGELTREQCADYLEKLGY